MSDDSPAERQGSAIKMIVGLLVVIVLLMAVLIGILLERRMAAPEVATKTEAVKTAESAKTAEVTKTAQPAKTTEKTAEKTTEKTGAKTTETKTPEPDAKELNKRLEQDTLQTEATNQLLDARSKLGRALKLAHEHPGRALGELLAVERMLDDLPELAAEYTTHNTEAENSKLLAKLTPQVDRVRVAVLATRGMALRLRGSTNDLKAAREALTAGLKLTKAPASRSMLEVELAMVQAASGEAGPAKATLEAVLKRDAKNVRALVALADLEEKAGRAAAAIELLERVVAAAGDQPLPLRRLARLQLAAGAFPEALKTYDRLVELDGMDAAATIGRGRALLGAGEAGEARAVFTDAIDKDPRLPDGYHFRGLAYLAERKLSQSVKDFEVAMSRDAKFKPAALGLARALELLGQEERARPMFLRAAADPELVQEANARLARHFLWRADPLLCGAIGTSDLQRQALLKGAETAAAKAKGHPIAAWVAKRLAGQAATLVDNTAEATFLLAEGRRYVGLAQRSRKRQYVGAAQRALSLAWVLDPKRAEAYLVFAQLQADWSELGAALAAATRAVEVAPALAPAHLLRGQLLGSRLAKAERDPAAARKALALALKHAANDGARLEAHLALARSYLAQGNAPSNLTAARDALTKAGGLIPEDLSRLGDAAGAAQEVVTEWRSVCEALGDAAGGKRAAAAADRLKRVSRARAAALYAAAVKRRDRLDYSGAIKLFDQVLALDPKHDQALYSRGTCYLKIGNFVPGILDFSRSLELNPRISDHVFNKVYQISYVVDLNRVIAELNKIVADHPDRSYVIFLRGFFYVAAINFKNKKHTVAGALEKGIADFDRTLELNPEHVTAFNYRGFLKTVAATKLADVKKREERFNDGLADLRQAKRLDPKNGVTCYLQAYLLMQRAQGQPAATAEGMQAEAVAKLKEAFQLGFKGSARLKEEKVFSPLRGHPDLAPHFR